MGELGLDSKIGGIGVFIEVRSRNCCFGCPQIIFGKGCLFTLFWVYLGGVCFKLCSQGLVGFI